MTFDPLGQLAVLPDPSGLLAAVMANPDSDFERLLYADWLDEQAGRETDRARYIRCFINFLKLDDYDSRPDAIGLYFTLFKPLLSAYGPQAHFRMDRGFIGHLVCGVEQWFAQGDLLRSREWVPEVVFRNPGQVRQVVEYVGTTDGGLKYRVANRPVTLSDDELGLVRTAATPEVAVRATNMLAVGRRWPGTRFKALPTF